MERKKENNGIIRMLINTTYVSDNLTFLLWVNWFNVNRPTTRITIPDKLMIPFGCEFKGVIPLRDNKKMVFKELRPAPESEKEADNIIEGISSVGIIEYKDKKGFYEVGKQLSILKSLCEKLAIKVAQESNDSKINDYLDTYQISLLNIMQNFHYLISYWETKNPGSKAMQKKGENNYQVISEILEAMKINDLNVFRSDKDRRKKFFNMAKEKTDLTSEDRILRLSRKNLKKKTKK